MGIYKAQVSVKKAARCAETDKKEHGMEYSILQLHTLQHNSSNKIYGHDITERLNKLQ